MATYMGRCDFMPTILKGVALKGMWYIRVPPLKGVGYLRVPPPYGYRYIRVPPLKGYLT